MSAARGSPGFAARVFRGDARCSTGREPRRSLPPRAARAASSDHPRGNRGTEKARRGVPHSGYHRTVGARRPFFEGWYFRVTLPEARDNLSLIYHVYDPDLRDSPRRAAGCPAGRGRTRGRSGSDYPWPRATSRGSTSPRRTVGARRRFDGTPNGARRVVLFRSRDSRAGGRTTRPSPLSGGGTGEARAPSNIARRRGRPGPRIPGTRARRTSRAPHPT